MYDRAATQPPLTDTEMVERKRRGGKTEAQRK